MDYKSYEKKEKEERTVKEEELFVFYESRSKEIEEKLRYLASVLKEKDVSAVQSIKNILISLIHFYSFCSNNKIKSSLPFPVSTLLDIIDNIEIYKECFASSVISHTAISPSFLFIYVSILCFNNFFFGFGITIIIRISYYNNNKNNR